MRKTTAKLTAALLAALFLLALAPVPMAGEGLVPTAQAVSQKDIDKLTNDKKGLAGDEPSPFISKLC